ncbi:hypothetical protein QAD02_000776 [Eretmocerus hayati]|uniref:Uncharacterized protein n=1 Tax=Eretmocerus hayati TaxID=131215 RepID=A0ACC2NEI0_9HYME|nr:hypothetical protein QAD02_000776 [Eretmocerus hayati]
MASRRNELLDAVRSRDVRRLNALIRDGCEVNYSIPPGLSVLHYAVMRYLHDSKGRKSLNVIKKLISAGAILNIQGLSELGYTILSEALSSHAESKELIELLLKAGADLNYQSSDKSLLCPLAQACESANLDLIEYLIIAGAQINVDSNVSVPPICVAARRDSHELVKLLMHFEAEFNLRDLKYILTNVEVDSTKSYDVPKEIFELLLKNATSKNSQSLGDVFRVALKDTMMYGRPSHVRMLLNGGAKLKMIDYPLHAAATNKDDQILNMLLSQSKYDINGLNEASETPLLVAVNFDCVDNFLLLLQHGARIDIPLAPSDAVMSQNPPVGLPWITAIRNRRGEIFNALIAASISLGKGEIIKHEKAFLNIKFRGLLKNVVAPDKFDEILIGHVMYLRSRGHKIHLSNERTLINSLPGCVKLMTDSIRELEDMKIRKLGNLRIYDLMKGSEFVHKFSDLLIMQLESSNVQERYPIYNQTLLMAASGAICRHSIESEALEELGNIISPCICINHIIRKNVLIYLNIQDIISLAKLKFS